MLGELAAVLRLAELYNIFQFYDRMWAESLIYDLAHKKHHKRGYALKFQHSVNN